MNTEQKLTKIREKCAELLAIAEMRTPGKWDSLGDGVFHTKTDNFILSCGKNDELLGMDAEGNAAYIASCAGPAESGWKATIAAIDLLTNDGTDYARYEPELKKLIAPWEGVI